MNNSQTTLFFIWDGIYASFQEAAHVQTGRGFSGDTYRIRAQAAAQECLSALKAGDPIPQFHKQRSGLLPITVAMMLGKSKRIRVLDFGGGFGIGYMTLMESIGADIERVEYVIVEVPEICDIGRAMIDVEYLPAMPQGSGCDLVHASSSMQYVEEWKNLVQGFSSLNARYILLSDVFAGEISTFATLQNYYESKIPHWFLNLDELLDEFSRFGYHLSMKTHANSRRLNFEDDLPMDNFPEKYKLRQTLHLLLEKKVKCIC